MILGWKKSFPVNVVYFLHGWFNHFLLFFDDTFTPFFLVDTSLSGYLTSTTTQSPGMHFLLLFFSSSFVACADVFLLSSISFFQRNLHPVLFFYFCDLKYSVLGLSSFWPQFPPIPVPFPFFPFSASKNF